MSARDETPRTPAPPVTRADLARWAADTAKWAAEMGALDLLHRAVEALNSPTTP